MTQYLIAFNDEWVPDHTVEELREKSKAARPLVAEMNAAGVFIFTGGLDDAAPVFSVDASSGAPLFTDGPFIESKEHLGGFAIVDVADEEAARLWAGKIAVACGWPQEVRRFRVPMRLTESAGLWTLACGFTRAAAESPFCCCCAVSARPATCGKGGGRCWSDGGQGVGWRPTCPVMVEELGRARAAARRPPAWFAPREEAAPQAWATMHTLRALTYQAPFSTPIDDTRGRTGNHRP